MMQATAGTPILSASVSGNAELFPAIFSLYAKKGHTIADVTYGRGVFWRNIDTSEYITLFSDIEPSRDGVKPYDFRRLPYDDESVDILILDPPYMHGGAGIKESINDCYKNRNTSHESVIRLYAGGILESARVLRKRGKIIVKTQDEIESGKQRLSHVEIINILTLFGFLIIDLFVVVQPSIPAMRESYQLTARKNHSYAIVAEIRR